MLLVRIELHSARTGAVKEIGRMLIHNRGGMVDARRGDYGVLVFRRGTDKTLRLGEVLNYPRKSYNVWRLVLRALASAFPEERRK